MPSSAVLIERRYVACEPIRAAAAGIVGHDGEAELVPVRDAGNPRRERRSWTFHFPRNRRGWFAGNATPKREYYYQSMSGNRLFELGILKH